MYEYKTVRARRTIYLPKSFHKHAKQTGNVTQFIMEAIQDYIKKLEKDVYSKNPTEFIVATIYWNEKYERMLNKWLPISPCTSNSEFIRQAIDLKIRNEERAFRKALDTKLAKDELIVGNRTVKILRRLD